jgi:hypothetical protein
MTKLTLGFALFLSPIFALIWFAPNHGTSPDSAVYLQIAADLSRYDGTFPIGYPALIGLVSWLTGLEPLWASKVLNVLAVSGSGALWAKRLGPGRAMWVLSVWLLGQFVRIVAFTWSETLFLVLLAEVVWAVFLLENRSDTAVVIRLLLLLVALFLMRYVGGFMVLVVLIEFRKNPKLLAVGLAVGVFIISYFWMNQQLTGSYWGGVRFGPVEPPGALAILLGRAFLNEVLLVRDFLPGYPNGLAWLGLLLQIGGLLFIGRLFVFLPRLTSTNETRQLARLFLLTAGVYVVILFALRTISPFDAPNARLMAPATFCALWAALLWLTEQPDYQQKLRWYWLALILMSWLALAPH